MAMLRLLTVATVVLLLSLSLPGISRLISATVGNYPSLCQQ